MRLGDLDALKEELRRFFPTEVLEGIEPKTLFAQILHDIDNAPTVAVNCKDCDGYEVGYSAGLKDAEKPQDDIFSMKIVAGKCPIEAGGSCPLKSQGKWIPVSEKLPPNYILCLFCDKEGNVFFGHRKSNNLWYEEYQPGTISDVVAWQELPEPYKKGGAE